MSIKMLLDGAATCSISRSDRPSLIGSILFHRNLQEGSSPWTALFGGITWSTNVTLSYKYQVCIMKQKWADHFGST